MLYVNGSLVPLPGATCGALALDSLRRQCTSPLPALTAGQHTLEMATRVTENGVVVESAKSATITYTVGGPATASVTEGAQVIGATAALAAPADRSASLRLETVVATSDGLAYAVDIVAEGIKAPANLAWASDGRLFVAEADGRVRVIRSGERDTGARDKGDSDDGDRVVGDLALDARALLDPPPVGPMGMALHPGFAQNHFVYVAFLAQDSRERAALRLIRLRDVGGTLGEAATLFEAPLAADAASGDSDEGDGPRLAFGPDGLLYVALPTGVEFDREPAVSTPHASMLRLRDDGRVARDLPALEGVPASPIGFDWHPSTGVLWAVFPEESGAAVLRPVDAWQASFAGEASRTKLRLAPGGGRGSGVLLFQRLSESRTGPARAFLALSQVEGLRVVTMAEPVRAEGLLAGIVGRIGDMVAGEGGALFLATRNGDRAVFRGVETGGDDLVVRLTPRAR